MRLPVEELPMRGSPTKHKFLLPKNDGLRDSWDVEGPDTKVFWNPPFGKSYMKADRSKVIGAKAFQKLKEQDAIIAFLEKSDGRGPDLGSRNKKERALAKKLHTFLKTDSANYDEAFLDRIDHGPYISLSDQYSVHTSIVDWVARAAKYWNEDELASIGLIPAAVETKGWQDHVFPFATSVFFPKSRIKFLMPDGSEGGPAPMPCALVSFGAQPDDFYKACSDKGTVIHL